MSMVSVSEIRAELRAVLERVKHGDEVVITQNGDPVAVVVHPTRLKARKAGHAWEAAATQLDRLRDARSTRPERGIGLRPDAAEQLVNDIRRDRDEQ